MVVPPHLAHVHAILMAEDERISALAEPPVTLGAIRQIVKYELQGGIRATEPSVTVTKKEAARLLRVDRKTTLAKLVEIGALRTIPWPGGDRIPRSEIDRLAREGIPAPRKKPAPLPSAPKRTGAQIAAAIRALNVERLPAKRTKS